MNESITAYLRPNPCVHLLYQWGLRVSAPSITFRWLRHPTLLLCALLSCTKTPIGPISYQPYNQQYAGASPAQHDPWYTPTWDTLYSNELSRLCQGIGSGEAPNSKRVAGTNTFFCIDYNDIPLHKRKEICHTMVVCEVRLEKDNPNRT
jgi:hypothetical protein